MLPHLSCCGPSRGSRCKRQCLCIAVNWLEKPYGVAETDEEKDDFSDGEWENGEDDHGAERNSEGQRKKARTIAREAIHP